MASLTRKLRRAGARRNPRPRGHLIAGRRSNRALNEARLAFVLRPGFYRVTRRWPA